MTYKAGIYARKMGSAELEHVITARIGAVKDIPYELLGSNTSNKAVVVKGTVFGEAIETQPSTWTTRGGKPQVSCRAEVGQR